MSDKPVIEDAICIVPVRDVRLSADFYCSTLDFDCRFISDDKSFAIIGQGDAVLHLVRAEDEASLNATRHHISVYLWVKNLDGLYKDLEPRLSELPEGRVRQPFDQPYGMREFHVKDLDGCLLLFGEEI